jgi:putative heme iron utilization protein
MKAESLGDQARALLGENSRGMLASQSTKHPGFPFGSVVNYCLAENGEPVFLLSALATHTKNLKADPKVSLLVSGAEDLSESRLTLIGTVEEVAADKVDTLRKTYLAANPDAKQWIGFGDFRFYRLAVVDCYFVAGFGSMGWVPPEKLKG